MSTMAPLALVLAALATSPALAAKVDSSANHFLQRCRAVVDREIDQHFDIGICSGVMIAIHDVSILLHVPPDHQLRSCLPESVTVEQSVAVVVRWLDRRPHRWDENFMKLAMSALHETWPCIE
jgi:Rap1a immunity proteins